MTDYTGRDITAVIENALKVMPVVILTGMRQVGKSTLLQNEPALRDRRYISLDDFALLEGARQNPESLLSGAGPLTIDEAQKSPELLTTVKTFVDQDRTPGRFLLSGSANFHLLRNVSETLAGRAVYLTLHPFSRREVEGRRTKEPFLTRFIENHKLPTRRKVAAIQSVEVLRGGMPPVSLLPIGAESIWFRGYEQTYLERDIRELAQVADLVTFRNVLQMAALRSGQVLKVSELARDIKLTSVTASRYLDLIETSCVISKIPPYLTNRSSRIIKSPKLYMSDSGLACHLARIDSLDPEAGEPLRGAMFETFVAQNIASLVESSMPDAKVFFWNVQGRHEVDFVIERKRKVVAIEIKTGSRWRDHDLSGLRAFLRATPHCDAAVLAYNGVEAVQIDEKIWAVPLSLLLS